MAIINPFPHYSGFTNFTPVVPELYWNVYSQEERIKALCMEYVKLTAFTDSMVDTLNDQYAIIEDMQARFPELVNEDVIAEIRRLVDAGEFDDILKAEADRFLEEKTAQITANTEAIQAEVTRATNAENSLSDDIQAETTRATNAENSLSDDIQAETTRATNAEDAITKRNRGLEVLSRARTGSWSRYPIIINEEKFSIPEAFSGQEPKVWVNFATNEMKFNFTVSPLQTAHGTANWIGQVKVGPEEDDTMGFSIGSNPYLRQCAFTSYGAGVSGHSEGDFVCRDLRIGASGKIYSGYDLFNGKIVNVSCYEPYLLSESGSSTKNHFSSSFRYATEQECIGAAQHAYASIGHYAYSNNDKIRLGIATLSDGTPATDCSGLVFMSFWHNGYKVPTNGGSQMTALGEMVTWSEPNEDLDVSKLKVGDVIGYNGATDYVSNFRFGHVGIIYSVDYDNNSFVVVDQPGSATTEQPGPFAQNGQPYLKERARFVVRYWNDPDLHDDLV